MDERFETLLRQGDPARDMTPDEAARLRHTISRAAAAAPATAVQEPPPAPWRWQLATVAVTACALALMIGLRSIGPPPSGPPAAAELPTPRRVQIDFRTPGGTRIIWTLVPNQPGAAPRREP